MEYTHVNYLNQTAVGRLMRKRKTYLILGGILTVVFAYGVIAGLTNYSEALHQGVPLYVILLIPSVLILLTGLRAGLDLQLARRYNSIFSTDQDGIVQYAELSRSTGKNIGRISKELERLFRLGVFHDCTLERRDAPVVVLANSSSGTEGFVTVVCPHCGGSSRIRSGSRGKCEYCGGSIRG